MLLFVCIVWQPCCVIVCIYYFNARVQHIDHTNQADISNSSVATLSCPLLLWMTSLVSCMHSLIQGKIYVCEHCYGNLGICLAAAAAGVAGWPG